MPAPHKPTSENHAEVESLSAFGITEAEIARYIGIDPKTLRKHYRESLQKGVTKANIVAAKNLFAKVREGNLSACIFWLKARAGWSEKNVLLLNEDEAEKQGPKKVRVELVNTEKRNDADS